MTFLSSRKMRLGSLSVLLLGFVSIGIAYTQRSTPAQDVLIVSNKVYTPTGGASRLTARIERAQKADGSFAETTTNLLPDGTVAKKTTLVGQVGHGVYRVNEKNKELDFVSDHSTGRGPSEEVLRISPEFVREDELLGFKVLVIHHKDDDGGYTESHFAPDLQWALLKLVMAKENGTTIIEAREVKFGELPTSTSAIPNFPVNYDSFEKKIKAVEESGHHAIAEKLRHQLEQRKQQ